MQNLMNGHIYQASGGGEECQYEHEVPTPQRSLSSCDEHEFLPLRLYEEFPGFVCADAESLAFCYRIRGKEEWHDLNEATVAFQDVHDKLLLKTRQKCDACAARVGDRRQLLSSDLPSYATLSGERPRTKVAIKAPSTLKPTGAAKSFKLGRTKRETTSSERCRKSKPKPGPTVSHRGTQGAPLSTVPLRKQSRAKSEWMRVSRKKTPPSGGDLGPKAPGLTSSQSAVLSTFFTLQRAVRRLCLRGSWRSRFGGLPANLSAASVWSKKHCNRKLAKNLRLIRKHWSILRAYFELLYGGITLTTAHLPRNRGYISKMYRVCCAAIYDGFKATFKKQAGLLRQEALGLKPFPRVNHATRRTPRKLFVASCLSRALGGERPSEQEIDEQVRAALDRVCNPSPFPKDWGLIEELRDFIRREFGGFRSRSNLMLRMPTTKACFGSKSKDGGQLCSLKKETVTTMSVSSSEFVWSSKKPDQIRHEETISISKRYKPADNLFKGALSRAKEDTGTGIVKILNENDKLRVSTLHGADTLWVSRNLAHWAIDIVSRKAWLKPIMKNGRVDIWNHCRDTQIYSADMLKSTDPIGIELASFVLSELANVARAPSWVKESIETVVKEYNVLYQGETFQTRCGALMSTGFSWSVLCILNAFACDLSAPSGSWAICGDDMVGLFNQTQKEAYEANLRALGLFPNLEKSFFAPRGVFCERLVLKVGDTAYCEPELRLAEAGGFTALFGGSRLTVSDALQDSKLPCVREIARLRKRTVQSLAPDDRKPGRLSDGGGGLKGVSGETLLSYARFGPMSLLWSGADQRISALRSALRDVEPSPNGVSARDVLTEAQTLAEWEYRSHTGRHSRDPCQKSYKVVRNELRNRWSWASKKLKAFGGDVAKALKDTLKEETYVRVRPRLLKKMSHLLRNNRLTAVLLLLKGSWNISLDPDTCERLFEENFQMSRYVVLLNTLQPAQRKVGTKTISPWSAGGKPWEETTL